MAQYFVDSTLINYQLIALNKLRFKTLPPELGKNQEIRVRLCIDDQHTYDFKKCHIDDTVYRRVRVPIEIMGWIRQTFAFSVAYYASNSGHRVGIWKNRDIAIFEKTINKEKDKKTGEPMKMDIPGETILISWKKDRNGCYLEIREGFRITADNAVEFLSAKAIASVLPYILTTVKNTSTINVRKDGKKSYIIDRTTNWLSAEEYAKTHFSHPGIYLLRRKNSKNEFSYYIGKALDIKKRIVQRGNIVLHPEEKSEVDKQYDEIACISVTFDDYMKLFGKIGNNDLITANNSRLKNESTTDNALYAIEDLAIHIAAMLLQSEGKTLDNKQYRSYTSEWIKGL